MGWKTFLELYLINPKRYKAIIVTKIYENLRKIVCDFGTCVATFMSKILRSNVEDFNLITEGAFGYKLGIEKYPFILL